MLGFEDCSGDACPTPAGYLAYGAPPAGNAFMLAAFAALVPPVIYAGLRYRVLLQTLLLLAAVLVEVVGHVGKILLVANPTSPAYSVVYLMGTHWGAVLVGSAVNLVLPHVMVLYGEEFRLVSDPVYLNIFFFILDIFTLAFQSVGIGFAATASTATEVRFHAGQEKVCSLTHCLRFLRGLTSCSRASPFRPSAFLPSWGHTDTSDTGFPTAAIFSMTDTRSSISPAGSSTS